MKCCTRCKQIKPLTEFSVKQSRCKPCNRLAAKEWNMANPERKKAWREANKERIEETHRKYVAANKHKLAAHTRKYKYGPASLPVHNYIVNGGMCQAGCGSKAVAVDHCHATNQVRGALCHMCNRALGNARDSIDILNGLIEYLRRSRVKIAS